MGRTNSFDEKQQLDQLICNITHTNHTQETVPSVPEHPQAAFTRKNPLFEKFKEKKNTHTFVSQLLSVVYLNTKETTVLQVKITSSGWLANIHVSDCCLFKFFTFSQVVHLHESMKD